MSRWLNMRHGLIWICCIALSLGGSPSIAAIDTAVGPIDHTSGDLDVWQRIDFRPARDSLRRAPQIKIAIQTKGPSMQGLVRIPGGLTSNFDTGRGMTVVELINPGDETRGYVEVIAIEIAFTQSNPGQVFRVFAIDD